MTEIALRHLVHIYSDSHTNNLTDDAKQLERQSHLYAHDTRMVSDKVQGKLLALFSRLMRPKTIVEVGTFTGFASLHLASGLHENGRMYTIDHSPQYHDLAKSFIEKAGLSDKVTFIIDDAIKALTAIEGPFDLVFLDAAKRQYEQYYDIVMTKMHSGGLIIADNVLWKGEVTEAQPSAIAKSLDQFNKKVLRDPRVNVTLLPHRDGLSLIQII